MHYGCEARPWPDDYDRFLQDPGLERDLHGFTLLAAPAEPGTLLAHGDDLFGDARVIGLGHGMQIVLAGAGSMQSPWRFALTQGAVWAVERDFASFTLLRRFLADTSAVLGLLRVRFLRQLTRVREHMLRDPDFRRMLLAHARIAAGRRARARRA